MTFRRTSFAKSPNSEIWEFPDIRMSKNDVSIFFHFFTWMLVSPKSRVIGFGSHGHVHQVRKSWTSWLSGFSESENWKVLVQNEAECLRSFWAAFLITFEVNIGPQTTADPKSEFFYRAPVEPLLGCPRTSHTWHNFPITSNSMDRRWVAIASKHFGSRGRNR